MTDEITTKNLPANILELDESALKEALSAFYIQEGAPDALAAWIKAQLPETTKDDILRSEATKLRSFRVKIEKVGDALKADADARVKAIRAVRDTFSEKIQTVHDDFRKPLTDKEEAEKLRVKKCTEITNKIFALGEKKFGDNTVEVQKRLEELRAIVITEEEFKERALPAQTVLSEAISTLDQHLAVLFEQEREAARAAAEREENERLRQELARKQAAEDEARRIEAAKEQTRIDAEKKAAEAIEAEKQKAALEAQRKATEEAAERDRIRREAEAQIARVKKAADDAEAARVAEEARLKAEAIARANDNARRETIRADIIKAITANGIENDTASIVTALLMDGDIPHVQIKF